VSTILEDPIRVAVVEDAGLGAVPLAAPALPRDARVMLTVYESEDKVFESLRNGACGYVLKKAPPGELMEAVRDAHRAALPCPPRSPAR
jgi:DNA-binding NarL/FixJ family response regulator